MSLDVAIQTRELRSRVPELPVAAEEADGTPANIFIVWDRTAVSSDRSVGLWARRKTIRSGVRAVDDVSFTHPLRQTSRLLLLAGLRLLNTAVQLGKFVQKNDERKIAPLNQKGRPSNRD